MAIPIKLITGDNSIVVDLEAQSIDMAIDRNVSAFPTPNNLLKRFAVDTNIPRIAMEINGILTDDDGVDISGITNVDDAAVINPSRHIINFGSIIPTVPYDPAPVNRGDINSIYQDRVIEVKSERDYIKGSTNTLVVVGQSDIDETDVLDGFDTYFEFSGSHLAGATGALSVQRITGAGFSAKEEFAVDDRVTNEDGDLLGIITAVSDTTITLSAGLGTAVSSGDKIMVSSKAYNYRHEFLGHITDADIGSTSTTLTLDRNIESQVLEGTKIGINKHTNSIEQLLDNAYIKLVPTYWSEDPNRGPSGRTPKTDVETLGTVGQYGIRFKFNARQIPAIAGGSANITVSKKAGFFTGTFPGIPKGDAARGDAVVDIPIKNITLTEGINPALELAALFEEAMKVTADVVTAVVPLNPSGDVKLYNSGEFTTFKVKVSGPVAIIEDIYVPENNPFASASIISRSLYDDFNPQVFTSTSSFSSLTKKSAGDKAQDLIGLVSNANTTKGDLFQGIQIPYDSLITSSGVTGIARNFFLTFGDIAPSEKGALANNRSASELMRELSLTGDAGGNKSDKGENKESLLANWAGSIVPDEVESLVGFLTNAVSDVFVTLDTEAHGNDGGIRIMPEKLHVRYDAGNNYYAYNLLLVATDFVIGV